MVTHRKPDMRSVDMYSEDLQFFKDIKKELNIKSIALTIHFVIDEYGEYLKNEPKKVKK